MATVTTFSITPDQIRGDQLVDEILQATGLDVGMRYTFHPPDRVAIAGDDVAAAQAQIQATIDAHVPDPLYFTRDVELKRQMDAEASVASIPNWATWTETEALAWFDANVVDAPTAIQVERALVRLVLALRNKNWPNLEGS
jgi:hypothetical protein